MQGHTARRGLHPSAFIQLRGELKFIGKREPGHNDRLIRCTAGALIAEHIHPYVRHDMDILSGNIRNPIDRKDQEVFFAAQRIVGRFFIIRIVHIVTREEIELLFNDLATNKNGKTGLFGIAA